MNNNKSLNILVMLINAKATVVAHRYASQLLLESLIDVLKTLGNGNDIMDLSRSLDRWYKTQQSIAHSLKIDKIVKQHVWELALVATALDWGRRSLITELESMV